MDSERLKRDYYSRLTAEEQQIVAYVWNGDCVSNVELQQMLGLNSIDVGKLLHQMVEKQILNQENKKRWTTYNIRRDNSIYYSSDKKNDKKNEGRIKGEFTVIERQVLALITEDANVTYETLGQKLALGKTTLYKAVHNLKNLNIIVREGGRKDGYWKIIKTL